MTDVVGRYVSLLAHEMNNPLTIVVGQTAMFKTQCATGAVDPNAARDRLDKIDRQTTRVIELVRELREALRDPNAETPEVIPLADLLASSRIFNARFCRLTGATVTFEASSEGPLIGVRAVATRRVLWQAIGRLVLIPRNVRAFARTSAHHLHLVIAGEGPAVFTPDEIAALGREVARDQIVIGPWSAAAEAGLEFRFPRVD